MLQRPDLATLRNSDRIAQREALDAMLAQWCATRSRAEVVATLVHLGLAVTPVNTLWRLLLTSTFRRATCW